MPRQSACFRPQRASFRSKSSASPSFSPSYSQGSSRPAKVARGYKAMDGIMTSLMLEKAQRCTEQAKDLLEDLSESKMTFYRKGQKAGLLYQEHYDIPLPALPASASAAEQQAYAASAADFQRVLERFGKYSWVDEALQHGINLILSAVGQGHALEAVMFEEAVPAVTQTMLRELGKSLRSMLDSAVHEAWVGASVEAEGQILGLKEEAEAAKAQQAAATQQVNYKGQLAKSEQGRADVVEQCITARKRNIVLGQQVADTKAAVNTLQSQADLAAERVAASALLEEELRREVASSQQAKPEAEAQQKSADKKVAAKVQQKLASLVGEVKALKAKVKLFEEGKVQDLTARQPKLDQLQRDLSKSQDATLELTASMTLAQDTLTTSRQQIASLREELANSQSEHRAAQASAKEAKLVANETVAALRMEQEQLRDALHQSRQVEVDADARCVAADKKLAACQETSAGLQQQLRHTMDAYGTALQAKNALEDEREDLVWLADDPVWRINTSAIYNLLHSSDAWRDIKRQLQDLPVPLQGYGQPAVLRASLPQAPALAPEPLPEATLPIVQTLPEGILPTINPETLPEGNLPTIETLPEGIPPTITPETLPEGTLPTITPETLPEGILPIITPETLPEGILPTITPETLPEGIASKKTAALIGSQPTSPAKGSPRIQAVGGLASQQEGQTGLGQDKEHVNMAAGGVAFGDLLSITPQALPQDTQANIPAVPLQGPSGLAPPVAVNSAQSIQIRRPSKEQHKKDWALQSILAIKPELSFEGAKNLVRTLVECSTQEVFEGMIEYVLEGRDGMADFCRLSWGELMGARKRHRATNGGRR